jgi:hypothetical protein
MAVLVELFYFGTPRNHHEDCFGVPVLCSFHERRVPLALRRIHVCTFVQQEADYLKVLWN